MQYFYFIELNYYKIGVLNEKMCNKSLYSILLSNLI